MSDPAAPIRDKRKEDLIVDIRDASPGTPVHEQIKVGILVRCTQDLESKIQGLTDTISRVGSEGDKLNRKLLFLNWVLAVATVVAAIATVAEVAKTFGFLQVDK